MNARYETQRVRHQQILACAIEALEPRRLLSAGTLDPSFGTGGRVVTDLGGRSNPGYALAVSGGKLLMAGELEGDFVLARYNANGTLDTTFGGGKGFVTADFGSGEDVAYALAVQSDGKVVLAGQTSRPGRFYDFAVARFNADGTIDSGFGTGGKVMVDFATKFDQATSVAIQPDGGIVVGGIATRVSDTEFGMVRLTPGGALDSTFGTGGMVSTRWTIGEAGANGMLIDPDGRIVLVGYVNDSDWISDGAVARYNSNGTLDTSFGDGGRVRIDFSGTSDAARAVALDANGRLVLAGYSNDHQENYDFVLARLNADGTPDATLGTSGTGVLLTDVNFGFDQAYAVGVQGDGKIVLAGAAESWGQFDMAVVRYNPDGSLDESFGELGTGKVRINVGGDDMGTGMVLGADGSVIVGGASRDLETGDLNFGMAKLGVANVPPVARVNGPFVVTEGGALTVSGEGSSDEDGSIVSYEWDFDYDGNSFDVDATGATAAFPKLNGPASRTIALRVTDNNGDTHVVLTTVTVENAAPVASVSGPATIRKGTSVTFKGSIFDPGDLDTHEVMWDFGDGTVTGFVPADKGLSMSHVFDRKGTYKVTFTVRDQDGALSTAVITVEVKSGRVSTEMTSSGAMALTVTGTAANDTVRINKTKQAGVLEVVFNGVSEGLFQADRVIIYGTGGNDVIKVADNLTQTVEVFGGDGNDVIVGGVGDAILHGEKGNDVLFGGSGHNLLDGGDGNDVLIVGKKNANAATLLGGSGNDVLIGGAGADLLDGGDGNDHLDGRGGLDNLLGGAGKDSHAKLKDDVWSDPDDKVKKAKASHKSKK